MRSIGRTALLTGVLPLLLGGCTSSTDDVPSSSPTALSGSARTSAASTAATAPTLPSFVTDALEDAGWVRNEDLSVPGRTQYQDTQCVVQLVVLPQAGPHDDAGDTELALDALGEDFRSPEDRADVALPVEGGALAMRARRVEVDTGAEVLPLQVAMRVVDGVTVAVTQACYDHPVADEEFDAVVSLLRLNGVEPSEL